MRQYNKGGMCFKMVLPYANTNNYISESKLLDPVSLNMPFHFDKYSPLYLYIYLVLFQIPLCEHCGGKLFPLLYELILLVLCCERSKLIGPK